MDQKSEAAWENRKFTNNNGDFISSGWRSPSKNFVSVSEMFNGFMVQGLKSLGNPWVFTIYHII